MLALNEMSQCFMIFTKFGIFRHFFNKKNVSVSNFSKYVERFSVSYMVEKDQTVQLGLGKGGEISSNCRSAFDKNEEAVFVLYSNIVLK
jgi:hypothetical protein